jgi:hypothetical protein
MIGRRTAALEVAAGMALPLRVAGELDGNAGLGPSAPLAVGTEAGVLVSRYRCLSLHSPDLSHEHWRQELEASPGLSVAQGRATTGVIGEHLNVIEIGSGEVVDRIPCHGEVGIVASGPDLIITRRVATLEAINRSGQLLWTLGKDSDPYKPVANTADRLVTSRNFSFQLSCRDVATGGPLWEFQPEPEGGGGLRDRSAQMIDVAIVEDRVVAVTGNGRVFALSLESGEVVKTGRSEFNGIPRITATSVFFVQPHGHVEFSHREMKEVFRDEYRSFLASSYAGQPTVHGFALTSDSLVWTTLEGAFIGISRDQKAPRTVWTHRVPGALMPVMLHPFVYRDGLYYEVKGVNKLMRFVSQHP